MSSFGAQAVYYGDPSFGAQAVYYGDPSFGAKAVYIGQMEFGAQSVYIGQMTFGAQAIYLGSCFPKYELVSVNDNENIRIGLLKVGDKIRSWDIDRKKMQYTAVNQIHKYTVMEIICFNTNINVSLTHPLMVIDNIKDDVLMPKWKVAYDVNIGDCIIGSGGKIITINSKSRHWFNNGIEVINLSTDNGDPFLVGNFIVRAENAKDNLQWADAPITQSLLAA